MLVGTACVRYKMLAESRYVFMHISSMAIVLQNIQPIRDV